MKNKNIKNKPKKCGRWLFLHSRFSKRDPHIKGLHQINPHLKFFLQQQQQPKAKTTEPEKPPPLKQYTRNLSLGYTEIEKKEEGAGAKLFLCDL